MSSSSIHHKYTTERQLKILKSVSKQPFLFLVILWLVSQCRLLEGVAPGHQQSTDRACSFNHGRPDVSLTCDQPWPRAPHLELLPSAQPPLSTRGWLKS